MQPTHERVSVLDVPIDLVTVPELHAFIADAIEADQKRLILHANVHGVNLAQQLDWLRRLYNAADLVFCDGAGIMVGARLLGYRIPERITYANWMWQLANFAEERHFSMFFLGGRPGIAEMAMRELHAQYPRLNVVGTHHGFFDKHAASAENRDVIQTINELNPDILVVGFGMPLQEAWLDENWGKLSATIALTGGAVFDYLSGQLTRGPKWMTENGFEWLARTIIEPRRLWRRYAVGNPAFLYRIVQQKFTR